MLILIIKPLNYIINLLLRLFFPLSKLLTNQACLSLNVLLASMHQILWLNYVRASSYLENVNLICSLFVIHVGSQSPKSYVIISAFSLAA